MKKFKVIITSGGTASEIDDIRYIGNFSAGTTGAIIAEEFLRRGAEVHYVYNKNAHRPFRRKMIFDPEKNRFDEMDKVGIAYSDYNMHKHNLHEYSFFTFEEYYALVEKLCKKQFADAIVLAAAVSDFGVKKTDGKISSDKEKFSIDLEPYPKVISLVKQWQPKIFQVGFKMLSDIGIDELVETAYKHGIKNRSNLTVANVAYKGDFAGRKNVIITPEKGLTFIGLDKLHIELVDMVLRRADSLYYSTKVNKVDKLPDDGRGFYILKEAIRKFSELGLFEEYYTGANKQFGFVAVRSYSDEDYYKNSFLITARGSNKESFFTNNPENEFVFVDEVNRDKREIKVTSLGKKASLNANVAFRIFKSSSDVGVILHSHRTLGVNCKTKFANAPGTIEDEEHIMRYKEGSQGIIELKNHGFIAYAANLKDLVDMLIAVEPSYKNFPEFYDIVYSRFQKNTDFIELVKKNVEKNTKILDLAAGTCQVAEQLIDLGYSNVFVADKNQTMIDVAKKRMGEKFNKINSFVSSFEDFSLEHSGIEQFDVILIRQAINYVKDIQKVFDGLFKHLKPGGKLIFNAPNFVELEDYVINKPYDMLETVDFYHKKKAYFESKNRKSEYMAGDWKVTVDEFNTQCEAEDVNCHMQHIIPDQHIIHTQNSTLVNQSEGTIRKMYDINEFRIILQRIFDVRLKISGFEREWFGKGLKSFTDDSKSMYCVATKA